MCVTSAGSVSHPSGSRLACLERQHCMMCRGGLVPTPLTPSPVAMSFPPWGSPASSHPETLSILLWDGAADPRPTTFHPSSLAAQRAKPSLL